MQTKTFVVDFATVDEERWEALLEVLKPIEVGVLGAFLSCVFFILNGGFSLTRAPPSCRTVNNVGVSHEFPTDFVDTSPEELATIVNVNVTATLRVTSLIAPSMVSRYVPLAPGARRPTHTHTHSRALYLPTPTPGRAARRVSS